MSKKIRYAVVGLGYFAQDAVLPAFVHARENSELTALISSDRTKLKKLGKHYKIPLQYTYEQYEDALRSGEFDAVYIVLPNHLHCDYTVRAAAAGIHVLCEKPMALTARDCQDMIDTCHQRQVKLMIAYRLHFEAANLEIIKQIRSGKIGEPRFFSSVFSHQVSVGNIRNRVEVGGGGLWDLGVYCVNAARYLFREEPLRVTAMITNTDPKRFEGIDETATAILEFPHGRLAQFTTSQGAADTSQYRIVGTRGEIVADPAYEFAQGLAYEVTARGKTTTRKFPKRDQVAAEIQYFSNCLLKNREPEPSGKEGLADVRIIEALYQSAKTGDTIELDLESPGRRPDLQQKINKPPAARATLVHVAPPSAG